MNSTFSPIRVFDLRIGREGIRRFKVSLRMTDLSGISGNLHCSLTEDRTIDFYPTCEAKVTESSLRSDLSGG